MTDCSRTLEETCQTCTETDKARDLELNKVWERQVERWRGGE